MIADCGIDEFENADDGSCPGMVPRLTFDERAESGTNELTTIGFEPDMSVPEMVRFDVEKLIALLLDALYIDEMLVGGGMFYSIIRAHIAN